MNWLRSIRGKSGGEGTDRAPAGPVQTSSAQPAACDELRRAAAAASAEERAPLERQLGRACGEAGHPPAPEDSPVIWAEAVCHVADKAAAMAWVARLEGEAWLAEVAMRARFAEVRLAAARRIADSAVLKRIADASREKDKQVYRHCMDVLRAHRQGGERARRAAELALALTALIEARPVSVSRLLQIEREIAVLGKGGEKLAPCVELLARAHACVLEETQAQIDLRVRLSAAEALRAELAAAEWPPGSRLDAWRDHYTSFVRGADSDAAWVVHLPVARELAGALRQIESQLAALAEDVERAAVCERFLAGLGPEGAAGPQAGALWALLPKPDSALAREPLENRWAALLASPASPAIEKPPQRAKKQPDRQALQRLLGELEQHLEEGRLADADSVAGRIDHELGGIALAGPLASRLQHARAQLARLRGWARWGTDQAREQLIGAAEALLGSAPELDERARAVPELRKEWKRLDAHGPAAKASWERFDAALQEAYRPVAELRAAEAARHEAARAAKAALCDAWEARLALSASEAPDPDYRALAVQRDEIMGQWRAAAVAAFRDERKLRKRLDALLEGIDAQLNAARATEIARREQLIAAVAGLRDAPDVGRAVTEAKSLQARWKEEASTLRLRQGEEQKLWQRFRGACDAVFGRRDAARIEHTLQREQREQARKAVLDEFEAALASEDAGALQRALAKFRAASSADRCDAGERADKADHRARDLTRRAEQKIEALNKAKHAARFALMAQKAALAEPLEAAAAAAVSAEQLAAETRQAWLSLPAMSASAERLLRARLAAAPSAKPETLAQGRQARDALLLDLEIALELPSPESHAQARRARALNWLQSRFREGTAPLQDPETMVAQWYAIAATPDAAQAARIAAVVRRLLERTPERSRH